MLYHSLLLFDCLAHQYSKFSSKCNPSVQQTLHPATTKSQLKLGTSHLFAVRCDDADVVGGDGRVVAKETLEVVDNLHRLAGIEPRRTVTLAHVLPLRRQRQKDYD